MLTAAFERFQNIFLLYGYLAQCTLDFVFIAVYLLLLLLLLRLIFPSFPSPSPPLLQLLLLWPSRIRSLWFSRWSTHFQWHTTTVQSTSFNNTPVIVSHAVDLPPTRQKFWHQFWSWQVSCTCPPPPCDTAHPSPTLKAPLCLYMILHNLDGIRDCVGCFTAPSWFALSQRCVSALQLGDMLGMREIRSSLMQCPCRVIIDTWLYHSAVTWFSKSAWMLSLKIKAVIFTEYTDQYLPTAHSRQDIMLTQ